MSAADAAAPRRTLSLRLALALGALLAGLAAALSLYLVPRTAAEFVAHGEALLREGSTTMRELAEQQTIGVRTVFVDLIEHTTQARRRALQDLPLELQAGDTAAIRREIEAEDARRSLRQRETVQLLAREMMRRADRHVDESLAELDARQRAATAAFADDLRTQHLVLVGAALFVLLAVLGFGLHHYVVRPTLRLREATQRIAAGELSVDLPSPANDELGDLARDFGAMVDQLRKARNELQELAAGLERQVAKKTEHLERALADLRSSHAQLAQAERLAALGTLAGGIAHEFHNVIGGIRGCAGELLADEPSADRRETLAVIQRAADRATGIVQQLLRFARRSVEHQGDVDLAQVAGDALRLCEPAARAQSVAIERSLRPGVVVRGDADGLHQVLVNLLTNALQAMPGGGRLRVAVDQGPDGALLTVADSGCGIQEQDLPHLFEPFFTTKNDGKDHTRRGTGLGLSVSYGIVTAHGGRITVQSTPGAGTTFTITLPLPKAG
jgi:signal transduction histidine kinase